MQTEQCLGLEKGMVRLVAYNPKWPDLYSAEKARIKTLLEKPFDVHFEHVGSTAIQNIRSKPIIDILIGCPTRNLASRVEAKLVEDNATFIGPLSGKGMNMLVKGDPRQYHYHVTRYQCEHWYRVLRIRDHLIRHPGLAAQYEALKTMLASTHASNRRGYTEGKIPFLRAVDRRAKQQVRGRVLQRLFEKNRFQGLRAWEERHLWVRPGRRIEEPEESKQS